MSQCSQIQVKIHGSCLQTLKLTSSRKFNTSQWASTKKKEMVITRDHLLWDKLVTTNKPWKMLNNSFNWNQMMVLATGINPLLYLAWENLKKLSKSSMMERRWRELILLDLNLSTKSPKRKMRWQSTSKNNSNCLPGTKIGLWPNHHMLISRLNHLNMSSLSFK